MAEAATTRVESTVREIRRKTRKKYSAEEKVRIVLEGLRGEVPIAELCQREGIHPNMFYERSKAFLEAGKQRLVGDTHREADSQEVEAMRSENEQLKALVAELSLKKTLDELQIPGSTFYRWYKQYLGEGEEGLIDHHPNPRQVWNRIPQAVKQEVVELALEHPDRSPRQIVWLFTDEKGYFLSESSAYRILKGFDLVESPAFQVLSAADEFKHPTHQVHELWQTDFTYFKIQKWGRYYLSTVLEDFSRYILAWKLTPSMSANDMQDTLLIALTSTGLDHALVEHRPRLLSDNGSCYVSKELQAFLERQHIEHTRSAPYHPMTQGKIERYHRSMKNIVNLQNYFLPGELETEIAAFVTYYNHERYHEALNNLTPADVYFGRAKEVLTRRDHIKRRTLQQRRLHNLQLPAV